MHNIVFLVTACKKSGPIQQMLSIIRHLDRSVFKPYLVTLYDEPHDGSSQLQKFLDENVEHFFVPLSKKKILFGKTNALKNCLDEIHPLVVHSLGVFPDFALSRMKYSGHVTTLRNYVYEDYLAKFGIVKGLILAKLHLYAVKRADKVWTCSKSLFKKYEDKLHLSFPFIQNGVELDKYHSVDSIEKVNIRKKLFIPQNKIVFIYSGQFIDRKNQIFLAQLFAEKDVLKKFYLIMLGDGADYQLLYEKFGREQNILMPGSVHNVNEYLQASDIYISSSKSEGLPNGVLEAMASGLPVVLSNIEQHKELFASSKEFGLLYTLGDSEECKNAILSISQKNYDEMGKNAFCCANDFFSARKMSLTYQREYLSLNRK